MLYMMIGRVQDKTIIASRSVVDDNTTSTEIETTCKKLLVASKQKLNPGDRDKLSAASFEVYYSLDKNADFLVCLVVGDSTYPAPHAYQCMNELHRYVQGQASAKTCSKGALNDAATMRFDELFSKYENPAKSSVYGKLL